MIAFPCFDDKTYRLHTGKAVKTGYIPPLSRAHRLKRIKVKSALR